MAGMSQISLLRASIAAFNHTHTYIYLYTVVGGGPAIQLYILHGSKGMLNPDGRYESLRYELLTGWLTEKVLPWHTSHLTPSWESCLPASQNVQVVRVGENILAPPTTRGAAHSVQSSAQAS